MLQQIPCWVMGGASCDGYACRHDQYPFPCLLFENIMFKMKNEQKEYIYDFLTKIISFDITNLLPNVRHFI